MYNSNENSKIIENRLFQLGNATKIEGIIFRGLYSMEDIAGKGLIKEWLEESGLETYEDAVGNVFGRVKGKTNTTILVGSHIDTVKDGGRYDGALGVITAILSIAELYKHNGKPNKTIEVVGLVGEEGSRYVEGYIGSRAIVGMLNEDILKSKDALGIEFSEAMEEAGYDPKKVNNAIRNDIESYIELHIEQGPILEQNSINIGIVKNIAGIAVYEVKVTGKQNHAGTTPMNLRFDPVVAAAKIILLITKAIQEISETAVVTVGDIKVSPGMSNVIAREARVSIDFRDGEEETYKKGKEEIIRIIESFKVEGFGVEIFNPLDENPITLNEELAGLINKITVENGISSMYMNSGAGHDAQIFAKKIPACMIFVPSKDGISHSYKEYTSRDDIKKGFEVLSGLLEQLAWTEK